jgi:asparagine N-glycosylation enzyme membrane subunit Stt3
MSDIILFAHPTFGVLGIMAAVWVFVEALNASDRNPRRIWLGSIAVTACIAAAWLLGGYWYTVYYGPEKAIILKGPWPWAHNFVMETKEHLFFIPLILAFYLPFVARLDLLRKPKARAMVMVVAALIGLNSLAIEGAGAIINYGVKVAFVHTGEKGAE